MIMKLKFLVLATTILLIQHTYSQVCDNTVPQRRDCGHPGTEQPDCEMKGCCWSPRGHDPWCFYKTTPPVVYMVTSYDNTGTGVRIQLKVNGTGQTDYGPAISPLVVDVDYETDSRLHVKIYDPNNQRWEIPSRILPIPKVTGQTVNPIYTFDFAKTGEFWFAIKRNSGKDPSTTIFNTARSGFNFGPMQFTDAYLQLSSQLMENFNLFGLGEQVRKFKLSASTTYTLWNFDTATPPNLNLYGSHPFYLEHNAKTFESHGVFLRNSNGMDIITGTNSITYNVIGGVLDFYFFMGPEPESVISQYLDVIGRPAIPPYWALGFNQCKYGYKNVQELEDVVGNFSMHKIPLETMWTDIDYMDQYKDFTLDPVNFPKDKMNALIKSLHNNGQHYVVIIDPGIKKEDGYNAYDDGVKQDIFIKDKQGEIFIGKVWPGNTAFPDFFNPNTEKYWQSQIANFLEILPVDGLWIDMNEISNFCNGECKNTYNQNETQEKTDKEDKEDKVKRIKLDSMENYKFDPDNPPYNINNQMNHIPLNIKTLDMSAMHYDNELEYNTHNLYGLTEAMATHNSLLGIRPNERPFVLSRSTFPGSGAYTAHWTGDNHATWDDLKNSIPGLLNFQLFGIPLVGSDICGFNSNTNEELCERWMELGSFYTFSRNHGEKSAIHQEPYLWESVADASRRALAVKYSLLPYYYTLFVKANAGSQLTNQMSDPSATVIRPLFFNFPKDINTLDIDTQFMVGNAVLVNPVLTQGATTVEVYFPAGEWYDWYDLSLVSSSKVGKTITLQAPRNHINVQMLGGNIIPFQDQGSALTTRDSRKGSFTILVVLDSNSKATGDLYIDDGITPGIKDYYYITYDYTTNQQNQILTSNVKIGGKLNYTAVVSDITIVGMQNGPTSVTLNGNKLDKSSFTYENKILKITGLRLMIASLLKLEIS